MGRLFWKFFFSYWAALLLASVGVGTTVWLFQRADRSQNLSVESGPRAVFIIGSAAATAQYGGLPALRALMEDWQRSGDVMVLATDASGRDLLNRPVPAAALERARQLADTADPEGVRLLRLGEGQEVLLFIPQGDTTLLELLTFRRGRPPTPLMPLATGVLASLLFGTLLAWYVARPIRSLRGAFAALSDGRLDTRVAPRMGGRRGDVSDLGRDFDRMAQQQQKLMASHRSLLHDVSHELRSPLARLQAAIGLARQNPQKTESSLDRIEREAQRVDELVEQLLTLSRLEARVSEGPGDRSEPTDLVDLVASIAGDATFEAQSSGRDVAFEARGEVVADVRVELLLRAVENVVRNAVKYTRPGTTVRVSAGPDAGGTAFVVDVADRGPGVPEAELEAIFNPFYRSTDGPPGRGFGLGLAITRRAIEAHGGRVCARNRPDGGLLITITLPLGNRSQKNQRGRDG